MIAFGICAGPSDKVDRFAIPGILCCGEQGAPCVIIRGATSIFEAYNRILDNLRADDRIEAVALVHDDLCLCDWDFVPKVRGVLTDPDVAVVGAVGARRASGLGFLEGTYAEMFGRCMETRGPIRRGGGMHPVDVVDGSFMVLSRWAIENLRFDTATFHGFHAYDFDICMQARSKGRKVMVADITVFHHCDAGRNNRVILGEDSDFAMADMSWRAKWGFR